MRGGRARGAWIGAAAALAAGLSGCDLPRDPEGTLERVRGGVVRAGVSEAPPWIVREGERARGIEADLIEEAARALGARVEWSWGAQEAQLAAAERFELDVVSGGLVKDTPWNGRVGLTIDFARTRRADGTEVLHVLAVPPGENAWLAHVDRHVAAHRDTARRRHAGAR